MTITTTAEWPRACKKNYLLTKLRRISDKDIREEIYKTLKALRGITEDEAKRVHVLRKNEVKAVLVAFGEIED